MRPGQATSKVNIKPHGFRARGLGKPGGLGREEGSGVVSVIALRTMSGLRGRGPVCVAIAEDKDADDEDGEDELEQGTGDVLKPARKSGVADVDADRYRQRHCRLFIWLGRSDTVSEVL